MGPDRRRLIGVGVGPGDPDLITVKAVRELLTADVILVPATERSEGATGRAEAVVLAAAPECAERIRRIRFAMSERRGVGPRRQEAWDTAIGAAVDAFAAGARSVVFATVGDPSVYSTFSYLRAGVAERLADIAFELVPGITAMQALAAASGTPLVEGQETLALVPATVGPEVLDAVLAACDTVTIYKGGRTASEVRDVLAARGRDAIAGVDIGGEAQRIGAVDALGDELPYFTTILSVPARERIGGRL